MIAYGMSKAAAHQLVQSMAEPGSGLPSDAVCVGVLPMYGFLCFAYNNRHAVLLTRQQTGKACQKQTSQVGHHQQKLPIGYVYYSIEY